MLAGNKRSAGEDVLAAFVVRRGRGKPGRAAAQRRPQAGSGTRPQVGCMPFCVAYRWWAVLSGVAVTLGGWT